MSNERYLAEIVSIIDELRVVVNAGKNKNMAIGTKFLIVGIGKEIFDPNTGESLGNIEIIRGYAKVIHVQEKISTLESIDTVKKPDVREITKTTKKTDVRNGALYSLLSGNGESTTTEIIKPQEAQLKQLNVNIGDKVILVK
ncbi:hypothetical protein [Mannheimia varigena]|uniref:hypothetical protein n=1 Tax=Mannheimia varigena TaxID=85404 RepID=UPI0015B3AED4|nr:hypothetical protein [Mannheimia varigena]MDY2947841.1 hypothetical protein [Mannheimia varigena]QLD32670.1 hypothetical protein A6B42_02320 [Mannheimia varigena]